MRSEHDLTRQALTLAVEKARYEAQRAQRQYDRVDPDNRLVAGELERRWNETLPRSPRRKPGWRRWRASRPRSVRSSTRFTDLGPRLGDRVAPSSCPRSAQKTYSAHGAA